MIALLLVTWFLFTASAAIARPLAANEPVHGWTILSASETDDLATIAAAPDYGINHIQLSHEVVMDLHEVKNDQKCALVTGWIRWHFCLERYSA